MINFLKENIESELLKRLYKLYKEKNYNKLREEISKNFYYLSSEKGIKELKLEFEKNSKVADIGFIWAILASILQEINTRKFTTQNQLVKVLESKKEKEEEEKKNNNYIESEKIVLSTIKILSYELKKALEENEKLKEFKENWKETIKDYSNIKIILENENLNNGKKLSNQIDKLIKLIKELEKEGIIMKVNNGFYNINPKETRNNPRNQTSSVIKGDKKVKKYEFKELNDKKNNSNTKLEKELKNLRKEISKKSKKISELEEKVRELEEKIKKLKEKDPNFKIKVLEALKAYKSNYPNL